MKRRVGLAVVGCVGLLTAAFLTARVAGQNAQSGSRLALQAPAQSPAVVELGRLLFWDPVLSGNRDVACATCHHPDFAYADGRDLSLGAAAVGLGPARRDQSNGRIPVVKRNSPTVLNTVFNGLDRRRRRGSALGRGSADQAAAPMLWDSRIQSLELQALEPLKAREEMRGDAYPEAVAVDTVVERLRANAEYVRLFKEAFGAHADVDASRLGQAIAAFERTLVAIDSPFDRFRAGDTSALTPQQRRGLDAFDRSGCDRCHEGPMLSDFELHAEGVREHPQLTEPDAGTRRFRFRTPSLRNVALTAPYMHNGTLATLQDVLRFYDKGQSENPNVTAGADGRGRAAGTTGLARRFVRVEDMSDSEMRDIVAFLESLTDTSFDRTIPQRLPSGLTPGGLIQLP